MSTRDPSVEELEAELVRLRAALELAQQEAQDAHEATWRALESQAQFVRVFEQAPALIAVLRGPEHVIVFHNDQYRALFPGRDLDGKAIRQVLPELEGQGIYALLDQVYRTGVPFVGNEVPMQFDRAGEGRPSEQYFNLVYHPARDREGRVEGILVHAVEVTEQVVGSCWRRRRSAWRPWWPSAPASSPANAT